MHEVKNYKTITHDPQWEIEDELDEKIKTAVSIKTRIKIGYDGGEISFQIGENDRNENNKELSLFS